MFDLQFDGNFEFHFFAAVNDQNFVFLTFNLEIIEFTRIETILGEELALFSCN